jgi:hypothetical protein
MNLVSLTLLHAEIPIGRRSADGAAAAFGRIEARVAVVDRLHAGDQERRRQGKWQEESSGGHRDGM